MADSIKLVECPRDAWQGLPGQIPTSMKVEYLKALIAAGFKHIDAASFVSPKAVPQMADSILRMTSRSSASWSMSVGPNAP
jgi:hydroxymethylglutaryl-CoA lyase